MKTYIGPRYVEVRFPDKPGERVRAILKANGFRWNPVQGVWWRGRVAGAADVFQAIERAMRPADAPDGDCWECGAPGRFRPHGAATPVLCDGCAVVANVGHQLRTFGKAEYKGFTLRAAGEPSWVEVDGDGELYETLRDALNSINERVLPEGGE